jgi:CubicO group peptidase (beta-lactamase class C family)
MFRKILRGASLVFLALVVALAAVVASSPYLRRIALLGNVDIRDYGKLPFRTIDRSTAPESLPVRSGPDWIAPLGLSFKGNPIVDEDRLAAFLEAHATVAFVAVADGEIVIERYFNGYARDSYIKSFSISKSVLSALIGVALGEGLIGRVDDPVTRYVPEMKDPAFRRVTLRHCLDNTAGVRYTRGIMPWTARPRMYYSTDVRRYLLGTRIVREPGATFTTDDLSPLILGLVLERALQRDGSGRTISAYFQEKIWDPIGAEYDALWNLDRQGDGLEKTESGFTPRPVDLAKFGWLYANDGMWGGRPIVPRSWVLETTTVDPQRPAPNVEKTGFYQRLWWGQPPADAVRPDYYANGHFGQRLYISPTRDLVLLRLGSEDGGVGWTGFLASIAERFGEVTGR